MIPVPGPVAPPQWYGPLLPDLECFISMVFTHFGCKTSYFHGICTSLDGETHISMAFSMQNLIFPWYSQYLDSNSLDPKLFMPTVFGIENDSIALNNTKSWYHLLIEGSLEVKLPTIWTDEKQSRAEAERRERLEERRSEKRKSQKKEDADARKGRKVAKHCVFPMIWGSEGSKSRLAKAAGAEPAGQMSDEKVHAVVARSTFWLRNLQNTPASEHFWKFRCRKSARRSGAKHITKSKCTKHTRFGPLLEVQMSKKCTPLWREAHYQVKMYKAHHSRTTFGSSDVEKVHAVVARSTFPSQNVQNTTCSRHFWRFGCWKSARRCGAKHISKSKCTKH